MAETKLSWIELFSIWIVFATATTILAIPGLLIAAFVGGLAGMTGYWLGFSEDNLKTIGSLLGLVIYLAGSVIGLKYALSKTYSKFKIAFMRN